MKAVFRTDASLSIGVGHVMRCLTLAQALRAARVNVDFICREYPGHLCDLIAQNGFGVQRLPATEEGLLAPEDEATQLYDALTPIGSEIDWLVFDHYAIDARIESASRKSARRIMVIDDLANRQHDCDLLLDQNLVSDSRQRYADKVPTHCAKLLGPTYALLQSTYAQLHGHARVRRGAIRRIFLFLSGADRNNLTSIAIGAFLKLRRSDIEMDVVITGSHAHANTIRAQIAGHQNIRLHENLPSLAQLMLRADLAIGAGGTTSWERACLGLPSVVITMAANQRLIAESLASRGIVRWLGDENEVSELRLSQELNELLQTGLDGSWSERCFAIVDGNGVERVCAALTVSTGTPLAVRSISASDENLLLEWANDPVTRRNAFSSEQISVGSHRKWFDNRCRNIADGFCRFYIVETKAGVPIGQTRFDKVNDSWEIDYALAPQFRGRGLGLQLMRAALSQFQQELPNARVLGRVKAANLPSCRVFELLGFQKTVEGDIVVYRA